MERRVTPSANPLYDWLRNFSDIEATVCVMAGLVPAIHVLLS
jgi:hypothetical protein